MYRALPKIRGKWESPGFDLHTEHLLAQQLSTQARVFVDLVMVVQFQTSRGGPKPPPRQGAGWVYVLISVSVGGGVLGNCS